MLSLPGANVLLQTPPFPPAGRAGGGARQSAPPTTPPALAPAGGGAGRPLLPQGASLVPTRAAPGPSSLGCPHLHSLSSAALPSLPLPSLPVSLHGETFPRQLAFSC